jgi:hypothetical protein
MANKAGKNALRIGLQSLEIEAIGASIERQGRAGAASPWMPASLELLRTASNYWRMAGIGGDLPGSNCSTVRKRMDGGMVEGVGNAMQHSTASTSTVRFPALFRTVRGG